MTGEQLVQALGTFVTVVGLIVVAPYQAGKALPDLWQWLRRAGRWVRGWLARFLPFLRKSFTVYPASGSAGGTFGVNASAHQRNQLTDDGTIPERLDQLKRAVEYLRAEVDSLNQTTHADVADLREEVEDLRRDHTDFSERVDARDRETEQLNTRGFPLAAFGALLAGVPFWFATWWWSPVFLLAFALAVVALAHSRNLLLAGLRSETD